MRIFVAGATGVIGQRLVPRLVAAGHVVAGMTRSAGGAAWLREVGALPVVCDVYDRDAVIAAVVDFAPSVLMHQLTDLPDDAASLPAKRDDNARIRREGTRHLLDAAEAAGHPKVIAQSVAWELPAGPGAEAVDELERAVLGVSGLVLRYGQFYGPGTFYPDAPPGHPRVQIDEAARITADALDEPSGVMTVIDS
ncbi:NAD-dependent epimerase/dehydratase family protein [Sinomonas sp. ASV322]|uniref:NAD-dependent epimerase/dehydratase family protein n=1 Tax=Sinomonas sp. ASV322 TaxID=3041920 RepID=UPI0027DE5092|nr:NAD-dependent epimerase/dehydratase family protein [Sinomonas sp. ASV322]MDQ4503886.1 NAD-dependent epimerase/dehydratase family protein [Sinomonas sp. ASV322]